MSEKFVRIYRLKQRARSNGGDRYEEKLQADLAKPLTKSIYFEQFYTRNASDQPAEKVTVTLEME